MAKKGEIKRTYPKLPSTSWWNLRKQAIQSPPTSMTINYLASVLEIGDGAAGNLLSGLRAIGFVDEAGKPTDDMNDWRDDEHYGKVCKKILKEIYPEDLISAFPPPNPDKEKVKNWFMRETKTGTGAARQMTSFYYLLCTADPNQQDAEGEKQQKKTTPKAKKTEKGKIADTPKTDPAPQQPPKNQSSSKELPVHIDIQIHIDSSASPDHIDQIFASMAKHLYDKR